MTESCEGLPSITTCIDHFTKHSLLTIVNKVNKKRVLDIRLHQWFPCDTNISKKGKTSVCPEIIVLTIGFEPGNGNKEQDENKQSKGAKKRFHILFLGTLVTPTHFSSILSAVNQAIQWREPRRDQQRRGHIQSKSLCQRKRDYFLPHQHPLTAGIIVMT